MKTFRWAAWQVFILGVCLTAVTLLGDAVR